MPLPCRIAQVGYGGERPPKGDCTRLPLPRRVTRGRRLTNRSGAGDRAEAVERSGRLGSEQGPGRRPEVDLGLEDVAGVPESKRVAGSIAGLAHAPASGQAKPGGAPGNASQRPARKRAHVLPDEDERTVPREADDVRKSAR